MNKKIKSKKIHKINLSKKLKSKSKSYKKVSNRKISNRKISNRKNYSKKIYRGGANAVPEAETKSTPVNSKVDRIAMFFDNKASNLEGLDDCPNVIKIKVYDNGSDLSDYSKIEEGIVKLQIEDNVADPDEKGHREGMIIHKGKYINYMINDRNKSLFYDELSGIKTKELNLLYNVFLTNSLFDKITDIIIDFDRTFTKCEGIRSTVNILEAAKDFFRMSLFDKSFYIQELTNQKLDENLLEHHFLNLLMGGIKRRQAMKDFLNICIEKGKTILILTSNPLPNNYPMLFPDVVRLVLDLPKPIPNPVPLQVPPPTPREVTQMKEKLKKETEQLYFEMMKSLNIEIITIVDDRGRYKKTKDGKEMQKSDVIKDKVSCNSINIDDLIVDLRKTIPDLNIL
jgi:hypothetical protein